MIKNDFYPRELVESQHPEAYIIPTERVGSLPKNKAGKTIETVGNGGEYYAQLKKDGYSYSFEKTPNYEYLFSRSVSKKTSLPTEKIDNVPHIREALKNIPVGTILVGEIYYPNKTSKDVTTIMGSLPKKAIERQKDNLIHFYIHDILALDGKDLLAENSIQRYAILQDFFKDHIDMEKYPFIELAESFINMDLAQLAEKALADGEEGIVMKKIGGKYSPGKRPAWNTIKVKKSDTVDVVCMGFDLATKEYDGSEVAKYWVIEEFIDDTLGWVEKERWEGDYKAIRSPEFRTIGVTKPYFNKWYTAIRLGVYKEDGELVQIGTVSSGLTDALREKISKESESFIGQVVECDIMEKGDAALRHPVFKRFRDDKDKEECTFKSIFG